MPKIIRVSDNFDKVEVGKYPYAQFPFPTFNVVQSRLFEFFDKDANVVIAAKTSAGKTVCAEMMLAHEVRKRGGKGMYLSPLKSLTAEKYDDWTDDIHHFHDRKISICTGDYMLTPDRREELDSADLVLMSSEMLNSRGRNHNVEKTSFLSKIGTLCVDEAHLLTVPGRGDHLESGLIKYSKLNPQGRIMLLSATMPNVDEIAEWITHLTKKDTYLLLSDYRPCPLNVHYEKYYDDVYTYDDKQREIIRSAMRIIEEYPDDKFLVFAHTKKTGEMMHKELLSQKLKAEYHNADLDKKKRRDVETRFKTDPELKYVVATSTLAWGCNLPARRVIILGTHRGLSEVATYDVQQMMGRAGRPQYDPCGDVYILVPDSKASDEIARLSKPQKIVSQMLDEKNVNHHKVLGFHLISEINRGDVTSREEVKTWFSNTLAAFQNNELKDKIIDEVLKSLIFCGALYETEDGVLKTTSLGRIASMFYYSPWDVSDLSRNFSKVFKAGKEGDDMWVAFALGNVDNFRYGIVSAAEKEEIASFESRLNRSGAKAETFHMAGSVKAAYAYFCMMNGINSQALGSFMNGLRIDLGRLREVLSAINTMSAKWEAKDYIRKLMMRLQHGMNDELLAIKMEGIGKVKAKKLWDRGLRTYDDIAKGVDKIILALNCTPKTAQKIAATAAQLAKS